MFSMFICPKSEPMAADGDGRPNVSWVSCCLVSRHLLIFLFWWYGNVTWWRISNTHHQERWTGPQKIQASATYHCYAKLVFTDRDLVSFCATLLSFVVLRVDCWARWIVLLFTDSLDSNPIYQPSIVSLIRAWNYLEIFLKFPLHNKTEARNTILGYDEMCVRLNVSSPCSIDEAAAGPRQIRNVPDWNFSQSPAASEHKNNFTWKREKRVWRIWRFVDRNHISNKMYFNALNEEQRGFLEYLRHQEW